MIKIKNSILKKSCLVAMVFSSFYTLLFHMMNIDKKRLFDRILENKTHRTQTLEYTTEIPTTKFLNKTLHYVNNDVATTVTTTRFANTSFIQTSKEHQYHVNYLMVPNVTFNKSCDRLCKVKIGQNAYTMIIFIKSKVSNGKIRNFIRRTWASVKYTKNGRLVYVFVLGKPTSKTEFNLAEEESKRFEDILMFDGPDNYKNIPRKTLSGMQWASENLPSSYLYSSADDDFMIDVAALDDNIMKAIKTTNHLPYFPFVCIYSLAGSDIYRNTDSKYYVPKEEYSNDKWPKACLGGFYTTRMDTITKIWKQANKESLVRMDDVWITGIVRQKAGIPDSCIIKFYFKSWLHTWGYSGRGDPGSKNFMKDDWIKFSKKIYKRPHCDCNSTTGLYTSFEIKLFVLLSTMFISSLHSAVT